MKICKLNSLLFVLFLCSHLYSQTYTIPVAVHFHEDVFLDNSLLTTEEGIFGSTYDWVSPAARREAMDVVERALEYLNAVNSFSFDAVTPGVGCDNFWDGYIAPSGSEDCNVQFQLAYFDHPEDSHLSNYEPAITYRQFDNLFDEYHNHQNFNFKSSKWAGYLNIFVGYNPQETPHSAIKRNTPFSSLGYGIYISAELFGGSRRGLNYGNLNMIHLGTKNGDTPSRIYGGEIVHVVARYLGLKQIAGETGLDGGYQQFEGGCDDDDDLEDTPNMSTNFLGFGTPTELLAPYKGKRPNTCPDIYPITNTDIADLWWNPMTLGTDKNYICGFTEDQDSVLCQAGFDYYLEYGAQLDLFIALAWNVEFSYAVGEGTWLLFRSTVSAIAQQASNNLRSQLKKSLSDSMHIPTDSINHYWIFDGAGATPSYSTEIEPTVLVSYDDLLAVTLRVSYLGQALDSTIYIPVNVENVDLEENGFASKLIPTNIPSNDYRRIEFGHAVAIEDTTIIVGAPGAYDDRGVAYIYRYVQDEWIQDTILQPTDLLEGEEFGYSVDIYGDYVAVGAPCTSCTHTDWESFGRVYVYQYDGSDWNIIHDLPYLNTESVDMLIGLDNHSHFGYKVKFYEDYLIVGDPMGAEENNADNLTGTGTIIFFDIDRIGQQANLFYSHTQTSQNYLIDRLDWIGSDFEYVGGNMIVSAPQAEIHYLGEFQDSWNEDNIYYVDEDEGYIFVYPCGDTPADCRMLVDDVASIGDSIDVRSYRGESLSAYGDWMAASIEIDVLYEQEDGVELYQKNGSGEYVLDTTIYGKEGEKFGSDVFFLNENFLLISADDAEVYRDKQTGIVYLYEYVNNGWSLKHKIDPGVLKDDDAYGHSIEMTEKFIVVGAPGDDTQDTRSGAVYIHMVDKLHCNNLLNLSGEDLSNQVTGSLYANTINLVGEFSNASFSLIASEELNMLQTFETDETTTFEASIEACPSISLDE